MTEAEWLTSDHPIAMLDLLRGRASERKLRLFGVACCRRMWHLLSNDRGRHAVEVAERYADGLVERELRQQARDAARLEALEYRRKRRVDDPPFPECPAHVAVVVGLTLFDDAEDSTMAIRVGSCSPNGRFALPESIARVSNGG